MFAKKYLSPGEKTVTMLSEMFWIKSTTGAASYCNTLVQRLQWKGRQLNYFTKTEKKKSNTKKRRVIQRLLGNKK